MGSADFGIPALKKLILEGNEIVGIVTTPPRKKGRGLKLVKSQIAVYAEENNMGPVYTPDSLKDEGFINALIGLNADLFAVIAFRILPQEVFSIPIYGTVNVHASLLPKFRGSAPIHRAIEAGETETGVTVFRIDKGVDTGNVIVALKLTIGDNETTPQLYERLSLLGADGLIQACNSMDDESVKYYKQNHTLASQAPKLKKEEAIIDWSMSSEAIFNKIRAFKPFPGTYTIYHGERLGITTAKPFFHSHTNECECGVVCTLSPDWFDVKCQNSVLRVTQVKPSGKRDMKVRDFLNGNKFNEGIKLG